MDESGHPAVERRAATEPEGDNPQHPVVAGLVALVAGVAAWLLATSSFWQEEVVGYTGRRRRGLVELVESLGQGTWVAILVAIALIAVAVAVRNGIRWRRVSAEMRATTTEKD